jgi:hypothetical protein
MFRNPDSWEVGTGCPARLGFSEMSEQAPCDGLRIPCNILSYRVLVSRP